MLTEMERRPLKHLRGSKESLALGCVLFLVGAAMMVFGGDARAVLSMMAMTAGAGLALVSGYYWGCGNESCSPPDL